MLFAGLAAVAAATSKWLIAAKIMTTIGNCCLTAAPIVERLKEKEEKR